jgi:carboxypeptidase family protein
MHSGDSRPPLYNVQRIHDSLRQINVSRLFWRLLGIGVFLTGSAVRALDLTGVVISALDRKPLKRVELVLRSTEAGVASLGTITDDAGRFAFFNVPESRYVLQSSRTGFVPSTALYRSGARMTVPFAANQDLTDLSVPLLPAATISGKVRHPDGEPAAAVTVLAYREIYERNRHEYNVSSRGVTDDHGEYRLYGLPSGRYNIVANYAPFAGDENVREQLVRDSYGRLVVPERTVTTFLPSSPLLTDAIQLVVRPGMEIGTADITLAVSRTSAITGRIMSGQRGSAVDGASLVLLREDAIGSGYIPYPASAHMLGRGEFEIRGVVPGRYALEARASQGSTMLVTRQPVVVGNAPEVRADVIVRPDVEFRGTALGSAKEDDIPAGAEVVAEPRGGGAIRSARIDSLGNFTMRVTSGEVYDLWLRNPPQNTYLKSAQMGTVDVIETGLQLVSAGTATLSLTTSATGAIIRGTTEPGANVALIPENGLLMRFSEAAANEWGLFSFGAVAPGSYRVISWFDTRPCEMWNPTARYECSRAGEAITVKESGDYTVFVKPF